MGMGFMPLLEKRRKTLLQIMGGVTHLSIVCVPCRIWFMSKEKIGGWLLRHRGFCFYLKQTVGAPQLKKEPPKDGSL